MAFHRAATSPIVAAGNFTTESTIDTKTHRAIFERALCICALFFAVLWPNTARGDDSVLVLPTGPTTSAQVFDLDTSGPEARVVDMGQRILVDPGAGPVPIRDVKLLPDGSHLLADVAGRGVAISDAQGQIRYSLEAPGARALITSASVSAFRAPGEIARILVTDSNRSQAFVIDPDGGPQLPWIKGFALPGSRADFVQAIVLPNQQAAIAMNWRSLGVSAIDIYKMRSGSPQLLIRRLAGGTHPNQPESLEIIPEVTELRDIMGLPGGNLLVTTRFGLFELNVAGRVLWKVDLGQTGRPGDDAPPQVPMQGEFASATLLPSGDIAVATRQPGVWTAPHLNHRVYWLSAAALEASEIEVIARSEALNFAPARLRPATSQGASGTFGFSPGLGTPDDGSISDLALVEGLRLDRSSYAPGETIYASADIKNSGDAPVSLSRMTVVLNPGACGAQAETSLTLLELVAVDIAPGETFPLRGSRAVDDAFSAGRWCARLHAHSTHGDIVELGAPVEFNLDLPPTGPGSTVDVGDLDFWADGDTGAGAPDAGAGDVGDRREVSGCGCSTGAPASIPAAWLALSLVLASGTMRRKHS